MMGLNQMLLDMLEDDVFDVILIVINEGEFNNIVFDVVLLFEDDIFFVVLVIEWLDVLWFVDLCDYVDCKFVLLVEGFVIYVGFWEVFYIVGFELEIVIWVNDIFLMISLVQVGVGFVLLLGWMKKVYEKDVQLLKLVEFYQMCQLIFIVYLYYCECDVDLLVLVVEGWMYVCSINC